MKTVRRPLYPKWNSGYFPCSSLTPLPLSSRRPSVSFGGFGLNLTSSTISANTSTGQTHSSGGGIFNTDNGTVRLANTIVAGNTAPNIPDCNEFISQGHNLTGTSDGCSFIPTPGDLTNVDPLLGPLQDNGGPTLTHALLSDSPAIGAGSCEDADGNPVTTDQRGIARPQGAACDIGAFELETELAGIIVNSTADAIDVNPGDGICDDGAGNCTLRAAIEEANALLGTDTIAFNILGEGPHTIQPTSALPTITGPVGIDGYTQPGASENTNSPSPNPPKDTDGRREESGRGVRELQGK